MKGGLRRYYFALNSLSQFSNTSNCFGSTAGNSNPIPMFDCGWTTAASGVTEFHLR
jgi:hypothetical protein